jgi:hypothetical protein
LGVRLDLRTLSGVSLPTSGFSDFSASWICRFIRFFSLLVSSLPYLASSDFFPPGFVASLFNFIRFCSLLVSWLPYSASSDSVPSWFRGFLIQLHKSLCTAAIDPRAALGANERLRILPYRRTVTFPSLPRFNQTKSLSRGERNALAFRNNRVASPRLTRPSKPSFSSAHPLVGPDFADGDRSNVFGEVT